MSQKEAVVEHENEAPRMTTEDELKVVLRIVKIVRRKASDLERGFEVLRSAVDDAIKEVAASKGVELE